MKIFMDVGVEMYTYVYLNRKETSITGHTVIFSWDFTPSRLDSSSAPKR